MPPLDRSSRIILWSILGLVVVAGASVLVRIAAPRATVETSPYLQPATNKSAAALGERQRKPEGARAGIGWSLDKVMSTWGPDQGWEWYHKEPALSGEPGVIDYRARRTSDHKDEMQVVGPPDDLRSFAIFTSSESFDVLATTQGVLQWAERAAALPVIVADADAQRVHSWFHIALTRFLAEMTEADEQGRQVDIFHSEDRSVGRVDLGLMFILGKKGILVNVSVSLADSETRHPPLSEEPIQSPTTTAFTYKNVSVRTVDESVTILGEITNQTLTNYASAAFTLSLYDAEQTLLDTSTIILNGFAAGQTRSFEEYSDLTSLPPGWTFKFDVEFTFE